MFKPAPQAIPPFQDLATLAWHVCMSERTIEEKVRLGQFPPPRRNKCGKRIWVWKEVEEWMLQADDEPSTDLGERIRLSAMRASHGNR